MDEQQRCRNCKWWDAAVPGDPTNLDGFCEMGDSKDGEPIHRETKVWAVINDEFGDTTGWEAWLMTKADFGCVQFEAKPTTD